VLRDEDLLKLVGRADHGGDFLRLVHQPTGLFRHHPGPMKGVDQHRLLQRWCDEIEAELKAAGRTEFLIEDWRQGR
jgi:hypothetical protein